MKSYEFKVLLYFDGSQQAFSAAVYTATLLKKLPNMHLTILQVQESDEGSIGTEYSWLELRPKYKRYYWGCSTGTEDNWIDSWLASPKSDWLKAVLDEPESDLKYQYYKILAKTNEIFSRKKFFVKQQVLCSNASISETMGIADTVDAIVDYSVNNSFDLIIMGTRGLSSLKGLIFGSLAHNVLDKSTLPVLLIKKLPQEYIDNYLSESGS